MKRYFTPLLLVLTTLTATAQDVIKTAPAQDATKPASKIWWLQLQVGGGINNAFDMRGELNTPSIETTTNQYIKYNNISGFYTIGISGMKLFGEQLLLGGSLNYGMILKQTTGDIAEFTTSTYNGMLNIGDLLYNKDGLMLYPYGGVGYSIYSMDVKNVSTSGATVAFDLNNPIAAGEKKTYTTDYVMFELALGVKKVLNPNFTVGLDAGLYFSSTYGGDWRNDGSAISSHKAPGSNGGFARLTLSYGLFQ